MRMKTMVSLRSIINLQTLIVTASAVLSTWYCRHMGYIANFPLTLIGIAVVFPVVFSIGGAYKRRETALNHYGSLKGNGFAIQLAVRDWPAEADHSLTDSMRKELTGMLTACRDLLSAPLAESDENERKVLASFSRLSLLIRKLRDGGMAAGDLSRANQYLEKMLISFEKLKHIYQYRTPRTLRTYSKLFIFILPALYGPYFAHISKEFGPALSYIVPVLFSVVLVSLDNIQDHLENPFDQIGEDDITINAEKFGQTLEFKEGA